MRSDSSTSSQESEVFAIPLKKSEASGTCGVTTSTNTPTKSTPPGSEKKTIIQATFEESIQKTYPTTISFVLDFLAQAFPLLAEGRVSKTLVARYSSRYAELRRLKNLSYYSSKTLKDYSVMTEEQRSASSFKRWMNWGTGSNGRYLTAATGFLKTGSVSSLSDILEDQVADRYFLSEKQMAWFREKAMEDPKFRMKLAQQSTADTEQDGELTPKNNS